MPTFRTSRRVRHTASDMFDLVADVEHYPLFLPLCQSLDIRRRTTLDDGREQLLADMRIGYKAIRETFTSRVTMDRPQMQILVEYVDGPFKRMENRWRFVDLPSGSKGPESTVEFFIDYEFKSRMFGMLMGSVFEAAFRRFAEAFEERANRVYPHAGTRVVAP
ncbi:type II toxin-antitoxin system RatA family toxin [Lichenihabitans psoromatis]|uniref:type II toxin-antitoxin system RatA family toxin n=1 Tax=Lichenihabitans psoromatis TaxID=2528642 RepID=UPI0010366A7B|nr:SRPBCC family protein [Lichenihabitans psoromatis]